MPATTTKLFGYTIWTSPLPELLATVLGWIKSEDAQSRHIITLNPEMIIQGDQSPPLEVILKTADMLIPDGAGVVWAVNRLQKGKQASKISRVPGIEFCEHLLQQCAAENLPVAFIGAGPGVAEQAKIAMQNRYPGLQVVYTHDGFFDAEPAAENGELTVVETAASHHPKVVLVALGVPKQEFWIQQYKRHFSGAVCIGVGGSFDVWSGNVLRAPATMRKLNMEWAYRFYKQPWRIQRAGGSLLQFVLKVWRTA